MQPVFDQLTEIGDELVMQTSDGRFFKVLRCDGEDDDSRDDPDENTAGQKGVQKNSETDAGPGESKQQDGDDFEYYDEEEDGESEAEATGRDFPKVIDPNEDSPGQTVAKQK